MLRDLKKRAKFKLYLVATNILLATILGFLMLYWVAFVRPSQIEYAISINQYRLYSMDNLPFITDEITTSYQQFQDDLEEETAISPTLSDLQNNIDLNNNPSHTQQMAQKADKKKIAIIITNLGLNHTTTELALTLPPACALGFLPYTKSLKPLMAQAHRKCHEIYLYLPMETDNQFDNAGRYSLLSKNSYEENLSRLNIILHSQTDYKGLYSNYKEIFTDNLDNSKIIFDDLLQKKLTFVSGKNPDQNASSHTKLYKNVIPTNVIIDSKPEREAIKKQLEALIIIAERDGVALGYAQGFTITIEMIKDWLNNLDKKEIELVPISLLLTKGAL